MTQLPAPLKISFLPDLQEILSDIKEQVTDLGNSSAISYGYSSSLIAMIEAASRQLRRDHSTPAARLLESFIVRVEYLVRLGGFPREQGQSIVDLTKELISNLD